MTFSEILIKRRREQSITQEELAERLDISRQSVSKWECGESMPDADKFIKLSEILNISLDELAGKETSVTENDQIADKKSGGSRTKIIVFSVIACVLLISVGIICFFAGYYVRGKNEPETSQVKDITVYDAELYYISGEVTITFNLNTAESGKIYIYPNYLGAYPITVAATYKNGLYSATVSLNAGFYKQIIFETDGKQPQSVLLMSNVILEKGGGSSYQKNTEK